MSEARVGLGLQTPFPVLPSMVNPGKVLHALPRSQEVHTMFPSIHHHPRGWVAAAVLAACLPAAWAAGPDKAAIEAAYQRDRAACQALSEQFAHQGGHDIAPGVEYIRP